MVAVIVALPGRAAAQTVSAGVEAGINVSDVDFSASDLTLSFDRRVGGLGGGFVAVDMGRTLGIQIEALFSQKGTKAALPDGLGDLKMRVNYLDIPMLLRASLPQANDAVVVRLLTGPTVSARLTDEQVVDGEVLSDADAVALKSYDVGWTVGGAVEFSRRVFIDGRYTFGLVNVSDESDPMAGDISMKNRTFSLLFGVRFR